MIRRIALILSVPFILACLVVWQFYPYIKATLIAQKELVAVVRDIVTSITIALAGVFSYFTFFKGRNFYPKADIELEILMFDTPNNGILHIIKFCLINKGSITILNPVAKLGIRSYIGDRQENEIVPDLLEKSFFDGPLNKNKHHRAVGVSEKAFFVYQREFHASIWAVTYEMEVTCSSDHRWKNSHTVRNRIK